MNKPVAHLVLLFFDLAVIYGIWWVCNETRLIHTDLTAGAKIIEYNNRMYSILAGVVVPFVHIVALIEAFRPKAIESSFAGRLMIGTLVVLLVSAMGLTLGLARDIKSNGYIHCEQLDSTMTFSTYRVYTKNISICEALTLEKRQHNENKKSKEVEKAW